MFQSQNMSPISRLSAIFRCQLLYFYFLFERFKTHLITRAVEYCFSKQKEKVLNCARNFATALIGHPSGIFVKRNAGYSQILPRSTEKYEVLSNKLDFKVDADDPTNFWAVTLKEKEMVELTGNGAGGLDSSDVDNIFRIFVTVEHRIEKLEWSLLNDNREQNFLQQMITLKTLICPICAVRWPKLRRCSSWPPTNKTSLHYG